MHLSREKLGKEILWSQTLRNWKNMDASETYSQRIDAKEVSISQKVRRIHIPICRGYSKIVREEATNSEEPLHGGSKL